MKTAAIAAGAKRMKFLEITREQAGELCKDVQIYYRPPNGLDRWAEWYEWYTPDECRVQDGCGISGWSGWSWAIQVLDDEG